MRPIKYSKEATNLIAERMPNAFLKQFVLLYLGTEMSLEQCAKRLNYSKRQMERYSSKVNELIRQMPDIQAENEWLRNCNDGNLESINKLVEKLKTAKAEAYKEFAEKLKEDWQNNDYYWEETDVYKWIDNLLKELVGDT